MTEAKSSTPTPARAPVESSLSSSKEDDPQPPKESVPDTTPEKTEQQQQVPKTPVTEGGKKKRGADHQITKDEEEDATEGTSSDPLLNGGSHPKASAEVLKGRRILKARRPADTPGCGGTTTATNGASSGTVSTKENGSTVNVSKTLDKSEETHSKDDTKDNTTSSEKATSDSPNNASKNPFAFVALTTNGTSTTATNAITDSTTTKSTKSGIFGSSTAFSFGTSSTTIPKNNNKKPLFGSSTGDGKSSLFDGGGFGAVKTTKFTFGSKSSSNDAVVKGFGNVSSTSSSGTTTGSIFGSTTSTISTTSSGGGGVGVGNESNEKTANGSKTPSSTETLPVSPPLSNGEEGESFLFQVRTKLFKLVEVTKDSPKKSESDSTVIASVPPANQIGTSVPPSKADNKTTTEENEKNNSNSVASEGKREMDWKEVGIGPLRFLEKISNKPNKDGSDATTTKKKSVRIVQRRESAPGGQGTKLLLNVPIQKECRVTRQGDKFLKLAAFEVVEKENDASKKDVSVEGVHYLFKVKTVADADNLEKAFKKAIE